MASSAERRLKREFSLWTAFAFAFAFISPIVALYAIFGLAIGTAGPAFWWNFPVVFGGQLLVALVFAELVSRWPIEGSIYQWSRRLVGDGYGWFAGWAYVWTLIIAMATVALGAAGFVINIIGIDTPSGAQQVGIASVILVLGTAANLVGRTVLKVLMSASIIAEIIGSVGLAIVLLLFHRVQPLSVLFQGASETAPGTYLALSGPFLVAMAFVGWSFVGFESAGAIAEEVKEPRRNLPKAIIFSLTFIAAVVMFSSLAIILAIPDLDAVLSGEDPDPVYSTLVAQLGIGIAKPVQALFVIGFLASFLALQTSASRVIWSYARDRALPASSVLSRLSAQERQPVVAITVTAMVGITLFLLSLFATDVYTIMVVFTSGGFYIAFLFPLLGAVRARMTGRWSPGRWSLGRAGPWYWGSPSRGPSSSFSTSPGRGHSTRSGGWTGRSGSWLAGWAPWAWSSSPGSALG
ncbi:APC family permease [Pseudonocardia nigra]|uniref:APC family permease n=1 Tax=Pseudonocardia nigra TaxID=1921578 RepID=UPI001C5DADB8|nr:amino acid permease [Pseudonocardia nigra]